MKDQNTTIPGEQDKLFSVINEHGLRFNLRVVLIGDSYGLNDCLIHDDSEYQLGNLVEFYDARYPHTQHGQFISRYYVNTLLERDQLYGLCLDGGIPDWAIDQPAMVQVYRFILPFVTTEK